MSEIKTNKISSLDSSNSDITIDPDGTGDTIIASGNVGIGTTSPQKTVEVFNTADQQIRLRNGGLATQSYDVGRDGGTGLLKFYGNQSGFTGYIFDGADGERMRIGSSGFIAHGGTAQIENCFYNQHFAPATFAGIGMKPTTNSSYDAMRFNNNGGSRIGTIACTTTSTAYNTSSDHRLKENVADMTGAIDRVKALAPKRFNFIADDSVTVDGFLAHEAQTVVPEAVTGTHNEVDGDGNAVMQGIDQSKLVPLLTGALQEAIAKIEALEARVTALENA